MNDMKIKVAENVKLNILNQRKLWISIENLCNNI
jgi:hypothetical protein